jgi:PAS domain-containing protein
MKTQYYKIYCDLDGVITNFNQRYKDITGIVLNPNEHRSDSKFWEPIEKAGYDFWINMGWMPDGRILWDFISPYNPIILSAPSRQVESRIGKKDWVDRELPGTQLILRSAKHKKDFASPDAILIDDREDNINGWIESGGVGILHTSSSKTINELITKYNFKNNGKQ